jgi:hypothetical protein
VVSIEEGFGGMVGTTICDTNKNKKRMSVDDNKSNQPNMTRAAIEEDKTRTSKTNNNMDSN